MSKLKLYRELIDLRDDFDSAVNCIIDPFLEKKHQVVTMSIASNMSGDLMPRGELAKQVSCAKQTMIEELKYLAFQQNSLEKKLEELQSVFITNIGDSII